MSLIRSINAPGCPGQARFSTISNILLTSLPLYDASYISTHTLPVIQYFCIIHHSSHHHQSLIYTYSSSSTLFLSLLFYYSDSRFLLLFLLRVCIFLPVFQQGICQFFTFACQLRSATFTLLKTLLILFSNVLNCSRISFISYFSRVFISTNIYFNWRRSLRRYDLITSIYTLMVLFLRQSVLQYYLYLKGPIQFFVQNNRSNGDLKFLRLLRQKLQMSLSICYCFYNPMACPDWLNFLERIFWQFN